jgi:muramoyltetrapeptide carboxypeptidase
MKKISVGIVAASSTVPKVEFEIGVDHLRAAGFDVTVHEQVLEHHFTFAGTDERRAQAIYEYANDPNIDVIWMARGGYGAARLLPMLEKLTQSRGKPPKRKLLVGYSDVTVLHEFVRSRWSWCTLHAPMPAASNFSLLKESEWKATVDLIHGRRPANVWNDSPLKFLTRAPDEPIESEIVGGNLSLWASVMGTPFAPTTRGRMVFLEDIGEPFYRMDRMITQLVQAGSFAGVRALILGDFTNCNDEDNQCLAAPEAGVDPRTLLNNPQAKKQSLRKVYQQPEAFQEIFAYLPMPVAIGLPVGHGPNFAPLPLGAKYRLTPEGKLVLLEWGGLASREEAGPGGRR